jgi:hypothetical protein
MDAKKPVLRAMRIHSLGAQNREMYQQEQLTASLIVASIGRESLLRVSREV